jgi:hypothetical protein
MHSASNVSFKYHCLIQDWFFNESIIWVIRHYVKALVFESYMNYLQSIKTLIVYKLAMQKFLDPSSIYGGLKSPWDIHAFDLLTLEQCFQTPPNGVIWLLGPLLGCGYLTHMGTTKGLFCWSCIHPTNWMLPL